MIKAVIISIILALAVCLSPQVLARHRTLPPNQPDVVQNSTNNNNNINVNRNVNKNENNIDIGIENNQTQTQNVTSGTTVAAVPKTLPATGASPLALSFMAGAIPLGLYLKKYKSFPKKILLKS